MAAHQDMPPPGGFATINVQRTFAKPFIKSGTWALILIGMTMNGHYVVREWKKRRRIIRTEQLEHFIAVHPFLLAEQERKFLLHLRNLREEERELMKDHPGWKLGTLYGEKPFKTLPENALQPVANFEFYGQRTKKEWLDRYVQPDKYQ